MWFVVWPKKMQLNKMVCGTIPFHVLMIDIFIMLHMILSVGPLFPCHFCVFHDIKCHVCMINLTNCFEIILLNSSKYFVLLCVLPFVYQTLTTREYYSGNHVED